MALSPRYIVEFIGTFFLVLIIALAVSSASVLAPIAIGCGLMVLVYMGGWISGALYNPAVSLAVLMRGGIERKDFVAYLIAQFVGGIAGAGVAHFITGESFAPAPGPGEPVVAVLLVEALFTFLLAMTVLCTATVKKTQGNSYYGAAIGLTVLVGAVVAGPISGGVLNPAVGLGGLLVDQVTASGDVEGGGKLASVWMYLGGPLTGGGGAVALFRVVSGEKR